jgi:hypothetical protein
VSKIIFFSTIFETSPAAELTATIFINVQRGSAPSLDVTDESATAQQADFELHWLAVLHYNS